MHEQKIWSNSALKFKACCHIQLLHCIAFFMKKIFLSKIDNIKKLKVYVVMSLLCNSEMQSNAENACKIRMWQHSFEAKLVLWNWLRIAKKFGALNAKQRRSFFLLFDFTVGFIKFLTTSGFEPLTLGLWVLCSTYWATSPRALILIKK